MNATLEPEITAFRHSPVFAALMMLTASVELAHASEPGSGGTAPDVDVVGTWVSEPVLEQLGVIQTTITFRDQGTYTQKADFISSCDGQGRGIDCEYFWMVHEGHYSVAGNIITVRIERDRKVLLRIGQSESEITGNSEYPCSHDIVVERQGNTLLIRRSADEEATVFERDRCQRVSTGLCSHPIQATLSRTNPECANMGTL